MSPRSVVVWSGSTPRCDLGAAHDVSGDFVDGKTQMGPWALMCMSCHAAVGVGLGTGLGQHYRRNTAGDYIKVAG